MYEIGEVLVPATNVYGLTIVVPIELAHFFKSGRNIKEVQECMCLSTNVFSEESCFENVKKALSCAVYSDAYFNGISEEENFIKVELKFPTCERMWNFAVQFVSVA